ncbi:MAG: hypothetical protein ACRD0R_11815, partial [Acidimicrobiales bacterium]
MVVVVVVVGGAGCPVSVALGAATVTGASSETGAEAPATGSLDGDSSVTSARPAAWSAVVPGSESGRSPPAGCTWPGPSAGGRAESPPLSRANASFGSSKGVTSSMTRRTTASTGSGSTPAAPAPAAAVL